MAESPQFPLGSVLFPGMVIPLHVFEPRYRTMVDVVLAGDSTFGVTLIERGHEVGGSDRRCDVGTKARVLKAEQFSDGRWALIAVGEERFRVKRWHKDNPYPRADIDPWPDEGAPMRPGPELTSMFSRCRALASEAGIDVGALPNNLKPDDLGCIQMSALSPLAAYDKQKLLSVPGPTQRIPMLGQMLADAAELIELRLANS